MKFIKNDLLFVLEKVIDLTNCVGYGDSGYTERKIRSDTADEQGNSKRHIEYFIDLIFPNGTIQVVYCWCNFFCKEEEVIRTLACNEYDMLTRELKLYFKNRKIFKGEI